MRNHRRWILVPLTVAAVGLAFASVAYACTTIVGSITTTYKGTTCNNWPLTGPPPPTNCSVNRGDTISSTGSGLTVRSDGQPGSGAPDGTLWSLYFLNYQKTQDSMKTCMSNVPLGEQKISSGPPVPQSNGSTGAVTGTIPGTALPTNSTTGPALVCFIDSNSNGVPQYNYGTPATELEVL